MHRHSDPHRSPPQHNTTSRVFVSVGSDFKPLVALLTTFFCASFLARPSCCGELLAVKGGQRKQRKAVKKPLKEYFPLLRFCAGLSAAPPPHRTAQTNANACENFSTERQRDPLLERRSEWALKEGLINLSTAAMGPLGIFFSPLSEWEGVWGEEGGRLGAKRKKKKEREGIRPPPFLYVGVFNSTPSSPPSL